MQAKHKRKYETLCPELVEADANLLQEQKQEEYEKSIAETKEEEDAIRKLISQDLIEQHLKDHLSKIVFDKGDFFIWRGYTEMPWIRSSRYYVECHIKTLPAISKENIEIPGSFNPQVWRRIKGGPEMFSEGGYMSCKMVYEFLYSQLSRAISFCEQRNNCYRIHPFCYENIRPVQCIRLESPDHEEITVDIIFSFPFRSYRDGYLDNEESFDLLAVPFNNSDRNLHADYWLFRKAGLWKEEEAQREQAINKTPMDPNSDEKLKSYLKEVEKKYLSPRNLQASQPSYEKLVVQKKVVEQLLQNHLGDVFDDFILAGGSYEMTGIPGVADFDLECCVRMPPYMSADNVEECGQKGWRKIRGGPSQLLHKGYLSANKVRQNVYAKLQEVIKIFPKGPRYRLELKEFDKGSASIKMIIKENPDRLIDVDLVICVKFKDLKHPTKGHTYDLIAKPFNRANSDEHPELWRISISRHEVLLFEQERSKSMQELYMPRWIIYQAMKLIKKAEENKVLRILPSYFYKQIFIGIAADISRKNIITSFKEYIFYIVKAFEQHTMIEEWIPDSPNLLDRWTPEQVKPAKELLKSIMNDGSYYKLLEPITKDSFKLD